MLNKNKNKTIIDLPKDFTRKAKECFRFLVNEYNFKIFKDDKMTFGHKLIYRKKDIFVVLYYEFYNAFFYFKIIKGSDTAHTNDSGDTYILPFYRLFKKYDKNLNSSKIQPDDKKRQYTNALKLNAELLRKYGREILSLKKWININRKGKVSKERIVDD